MVIFTCDVNDADYIRNNHVLNESELEELEEEVLAVNRIRKSLSDYSIPQSGLYRSWKDNMIYYGDVRGILEMYKNGTLSGRTGTSLEEWAKTLSEEDVNKFLSFDDRLPFMDNEEVHTVESIEVYELANPEPMNLI